MNVLILHGPNLDLLGRRPGDEPSLTLPALDRRIGERARRLGLQVRSLQSNHEGALVDALRNPGDWAEAVVLSPGLLALTSQVLREAVAYSRLRVVEVHLEDASGKHSVRRHSLLKDVCAARVVGEGPDGYLLALERLVAGVRAIPTAPVARAAAPVARAVPPAPVAKVQKQALGRRERLPAPAPIAAPAGAAQKPTGKTLGRRLQAGPLLRGGSRAEEASVLSRAKVRARIAERLSGRLTPAGLSTWSRAQWLELQRGAPAESGQRELLEETLQQLLLGLEKPSRLSDEQLVELMTALDG
jgi:3-dehydroquinate dehydratase II